MKIRNFAPAVALFCLFLIVGTVSAQNRVEGHTLVEVSCQLSDGRDEPTVLPAGTSLWVPDPAEVSEDGLYWWVGIANPTGESSSMCWLPVDTFAYGPGSYYYDGYEVPDGPSYTPLYDDVVNTDSICFQYPWNESVQTGYANGGESTTLIDGIQKPGWQMIVCHDLSGEGYSHGYVFSENIGALPELEVTPEILPAEPEQPIEAPQEEAIAEAPQEEPLAAEVPVVQDAQPVATEAPAVTSAPQASTYTTGDPIFGLPSTGSGDSLWIVRVMRVIGALIAALHP